MRLGGVRSGNEVEEESMPTWEFSKTSGCKRSRRTKALMNTCLWFRFRNSPGLRWARPLSSQPSIGSCLGL